MKKKNYVVRIVAVCDVLVLSAKDESEAFEIAQNDVRYGDFQSLEANISSEPKTHEELEAARRHADKVSEPDEE